ncbi:winged helix-turn-helix transcriptional regulator [Streptomyces sp. NPDC058417]|uniref:winged helix-turn-helix transcriptional regulator n=1 Tax=unclassified Streptomyces TaxID=2593676 RepID=UPI00366771F7
MTRTSRLEAGGACSIARSLTLLGERWTLLVVREAFRGRTRFAEFSAALRMPSETLTDRLGKLVDAGVLTRTAYQEPGSRERAEYRLTESGRALYPVLAALQQWGDGHLSGPEGPPAYLRTKDGGRPVRVALVDDEGREVSLDDIVSVPGPGASAAPGTGPGAGVPAR